MKHKKNTKKPVVSKKKSAKPTKKVTKKVKKTIKIVRKSNIKKKITTKPLSKEARIKLKAKEKIQKEKLRKAAMREKATQKAKKEREKVAAKKAAIKAKKELEKTKKREKFAKIRAEKKAKAEEKKMAKKSIKKLGKSENNMLDLRSKFAAATNKTGFKTNDYAVYPSHGIGKITEIETTKIMGQDFSCYLMFFEKEKLTIKIPVKNSEKIGLRHLVSKDQMEEVFTILRSGVKKLKGMWSRRAQEYEAKINSGDILALAEVLRDLTRDIDDGERSYSERIIYETAVARLAAEYAAIYNIDLENAKTKVITTAKDKINSETKHDADDGFDNHEEKEEEIEEEEEEIDGDEEEEYEEEEEDDEDE